MADITSTRDFLQRVLADTLPLEEERAAVERLIQHQPEAALSVLPIVVKQKHACKSKLEEAVQTVARLEATLLQPPWHPATFIGRLGDTQRALVAADNRRLVVAIEPSVDVGALRCGSQVYLNHSTNLLLAVAGDVPRLGAVGTFSRLDDGLAVIRNAFEEEVLVDLADDLRAVGLSEGDRLVYDRESLMATRRMTQHNGTTPHFDDIPDVSFESIGGLDECLQDIQDEVALHVLHPDLAEHHRLEPVKGMILCGPPGCGKTTIARAIAGYLARLQRSEVKFLNVRPGAHRAMFYGQTEQRVREIFAAARGAAEEGRFVVMLLDDIDHLGARGDSASTAIDSRVLPSFLGEIDALGRGVWLIAATNRPDLLDEALLRPGRFGDRVFHIPRPDGRAAREILRKHLAPDLPYREVNGGGPAQAIEEMIEAAVGMLYAPNGEGAHLGTLVFRDGSRRAVTASQVMSGALLAQAVADAKRRSCLRAVHGQPSGIASADLLAALRTQLKAIAQRMKPGPALRQMLDLPSDLDIVKVDLELMAQLAATHEYVQAD